MSLIDASSLTLMLAAHDDWMKTQGARGQLLTMTGCAVEGGDFRRAILDSVDFSRTDLKDCDFSETRLNTCRFTDARLDGCTLTAAELVDAMFNRSQMTSCVMGAANLRGSFWLKAELTGIDLSQALMDGAQFDGCTFNDIVWPATLPGMLRLHDCRGDLP